MKIKRYVALSMRAALDQVRIEQGPDAVILSSRRVSEGVEVIAAVDYDEALMAGAARQHTPAAPVAARAPAPPAPVAAPAPAARPRSAPAAPPARSRAPSVLARDLAAVAMPADAQRGIDGVQQELKDLRHLLESGLASITWHDRRLRDPLKARVLESLIAMDIAPDVALRLAAPIPARTRLADAGKLALALLLRHLPVADDVSTVNGGVFALVGPTGAGKTTTIAKLASRWSARHGSEGLALVSTDAYRIGAREQLMTHARILGASMHAPNTGPELARVLERLRSKRLVLIDTAGMGPRDLRLGEQLEALQMGAARARVLLALPAPGEEHALEAIARVFSRLAPAACILTKVDEAASLGSVLSTTLRHRLPIAYFGNGQRVPEDLHSAQQRRVWLVRAAHKLKEHTALKRDETYYARNFGRAQAHA